MTRWLTIAATSALLAGTGCAAGDTPTSPDVRVDIGAILAVDASGLTDAQLEPAQALIDAWDTTQPPASALAKVSDPTPALQDRLDLLWMSEQPWADGMNLNAYAVERYSCDVGECAQVSWQAASGPAGVTTGVADLTGAAGVWRVSAASWCEIAAAFQVPCEELS
jgi:hypothetical protein